MLYNACPSNVSLKNGLAISYEKLGSTHAAQGNLKLALEYFEKRSQLGKELYEAYPSNVSFKNGLAVSIVKLGDTQTLSVDAPPLCLHAWRIQFVHPMSKLPMEFTAPPPMWAV